MKTKYLLSLLLLAAACSPRSGSLTLLTTNDVHGAWFDSTYVGDRTRPSLLNGRLHSFKKSEP